MNRVTRVSSQFSDLRRYGRRWVPVAGVCLLLIGAAPGAAQQKAVPGAGKTAPKTPSELALEAERLEKQGRHLDAARLYERAATESPGLDLFEATRAGWAYFMGGAYADALRMFGGAADRSPSLGNAKDGLIAVYFHLGDWERLWPLIKTRNLGTDPALLEERMRKGMAGGPGTPEGDWALGFLCSQLDAAPDRAWGIAPQARYVAARPEDPEAMWRLIGLYERAGRPQEAEPVRQEYLRRHPDTPEAVILQARRTQELPTAIQVLEDGYRRFPKATNLYVEATMMSLRLKEPADVIDRLKEILEAAEREQNTAAAMLVRIWLAERHEGQADYPAAERLYRANLPKATGILRTSTSEKLGQLALAQGKHAEAAQWFRQAVEAEEQNPPTDPEFKRTLRVWELRALLAAGSRQEAAQRVRETAASRKDGLAGLPPEFRAYAAWLTPGPQASRWLAYADDDWIPLNLTWNPPSAARESLPEQARRAVAVEIIRRYPDCYPAHYALAQGYAWTGDTDAAVRSLETARTVNPEWWTPYWGLGTRLRSAEQAGAKADFEAVAKRVPQFDPSTGIFAATPRKPGVPFRIK